VVTIITPAAPRDPNCAVSEAKSSAKSYDMVVVSSALLEIFDGLDLPNTKIVGLQNLLSEKEMTEKISAALEL